MSFKGILYSPAMIEAKLAGRKDVTRRLAKTNPDSDEMGSFLQPYQPVDILWIREAHYAYGHWIIEEGEFTKNGRARTKFMPYEHRGIVFPDGAAGLVVETNKWGPVGWYKRLGRFMPKAYCRMWDEVVSVRLERLGKITNEDAIREGILPYKTGTAWKVYGQEDGWTTSPIRSYETLWNTINPDYPCSIDPWVFRIETRPIAERPKDFLK